MRRDQRLYVFIRCIRGDVRLSVSLNAVISTKTKARETKLNLYFFEYLTQIPSNFIDN